MLKWLKKKLRDWILEDDSPPSLSIEFLKNGEIKRATATTVVGLHLICHTPEGFQELVNESIAIDSNHFKKVWKYLSNDKLMWEDGTPYNPIT